MLGNEAVPLCNTNGFAGKMPKYTLSWYVVPSQLNHLKKFSSSPDSISSVLLVGTTPTFPPMLMRWLARSLTKLLFPVPRLFISDRSFVGPGWYTVGNYPRLKLSFNSMLKMIRSLLPCSSGSEQLCLR